MSDNEFDDLFSSLRSEEPSQKNINDWKLAVRKTQQELKLSNRKITAWPQLVAACFIGAVVGATLVYTNIDDNTVDLQAVYDVEDEEFATLEYVHTKTQ